MDSRYFALEVSSHVGWKVDPAQYKELGEALLRSMSINVKLISWQFGQIDAGAKRKVFFEVQGLTGEEVLKCWTGLSRRFPQGHVNYSRTVVKDKKIQIHPAIHRYEITDDKVYSTLLKIFKSSFDPLEYIRNDKRELRFIEQQNKKKLTRSHSVKNVMSLFAGKHKQELQHPKLTVKAARDGSLARKSY